MLRGRYLRRELRVNGNSAMKLQHIVASLVVCTASPGAWAQGTPIAGRVPIRKLLLRGALCALSLCLAGAAWAQAGARANFFEVPFLQVTDGLASCPRQHEPQITRQEMLEQSHYRAERGTSCYQAGRCRLPNAYLYDKEIIPRVQKAVLADGRFAQTSVWVEGQRRWVWLKGCVRSRAQARALETLVRGIDDVESVVNELQVLRH